MRLLFYIIYCERARRLHQIYWSMFLWFILWLFMLFFFFRKGLAAKGIVGFDLCLCWWPWDEITMGKNMLCVIHTSSFLSHLSLIIHVVASWDKENMYCIAANIQFNKAAVVLINILFRGVKYLAIIGSWSSQSSCRHCIYKYFNSMIRNF